MKPEQCFASLLFKDNLQCLSIPFKRSFFLTTREERMAGEFQKYCLLLVLRRLIKQCLQTQAVPWGLHTFCGCESIIDSSPGAGETCDQCAARVRKVATHSETWNGSTRTPFHRVHVCVCVSLCFRLQKRRSLAHSRHFCPTSDVSLLALSYASGSISFIWLSPWLLAQRKLFVPNSRAYH